jgi:hypothetical protein
MLFCTSQQEKHGLQSVTKETTYSMGRRPMRDGTFEKHRARPFPLKAQKYRRSIENSDARPSLFLRRFDTVPEARTKVGGIAEARLAALNRKKAIMAVFIDAGCDGAGSQRRETFIVAGKN